MCCPVWVFEYYSGHSQCLSNRLSVGFIDFVLAVLGVFQSCSFAIKFGELWQSLPLAFIICHQVVDCLIVDSFNRQRLFHVNRCWKKCGRVGHCIELAIIWSLSRDECWLFGLGCFLFVEFHLRWQWMIETKRLNRRQFHLSCNIRWGCWAIGTQGMDSSWNWNNQIGNWRWEKYCKLYCIISIYIINNKY